MGGKTSTSTQGVSIPPAVLAQYQSVNQAADATAQTPFQQYGGQFVSPVNAQQQTGITNTNAAAEEAQPYYASATSGLNSTQAATNPVNNAALGLAGASAEQVNAQPLTGSDINKYLSPYLGDVLGTTNALANQNNSVAQSGALGTAISSGAFGGDRTGIAAANLNQQNSLAEQATDANILNTGYNTALSTAQQQQGVNLSAGQANRAALGAAGSEIAGIGSTAYGEGANTASELGSLGSGAQAAGLAGANAQIGAGTLQQQTSQAQDTAEYNQFLQQQSYPFQVDQFLANIAEGTGALSGSTTTTTQPGGFFSDRRLKHDIKKIGKTYDGQTIYSYKMHGDARTHIGLMAQDVEKKHPQSVGLGAGGYKMVDYGSATEKAANRGHFYTGGVVPIRKGLATGGGPYSPVGGQDSTILNIPTASGRSGLNGGGRSHYDGGGYAGPYGDMSSILATQENMYAPNQSHNRNIPNQAQNHQLAVASGSPTPGPSGASNTNTTIGLGEKAYNLGSKGYNQYQNSQLANVSNYSPSVDANTFEPGGMGGATPTPTSAPIPGLSGATTPDVAPAATGADAGVAPTAGLAGADVAAPAAADVAIPALADVAAPAAADAAGTAAGAAGATAASGAVDAGAAEAGEALAAEYLAADAATAAVVMARRGGRIKRPGLDAGGVPYEGGIAAGAPYSDDSGVMDIPDQQNTAKLQTAGALKKQPTGLQTLMTLGSEQGATSALGSMFSNQGLGSKRGGRIHKDGGGDVDGDTLPDVEVDGTRPDDLTPVQVDPHERLGLAAANDEAPTPAETPKKSALGAVGDFWDRNKTNIIPALEGLAAMGTAPTKHLGVALAAGLGAGAQSYFPTQQAQADLTRTQLQNQMTGTQLGMLQGAIKQPQGGPSPAPAVGPPPTDPDALPAYYAQKYNPNMTAPELARYNQAQVAGGYTKNPGLAQSVMTDYQQRIARQKISAQVEHDQAYQVATAPSGNFGLLSKSDPGAAAAIAKSLGFDPNSGIIPPTADGAAQIAATRKVNALQPSTGDEYKDEGGQFRNTRTGKPAIGAAVQTLSAEQKQQAYQQALTQANEPVQLGAGLPTMRWRQAGAASPEAYAAAQVPGGYTPPQGATGAIPQPQTRPAVPPQRPTPTRPASAPSTSAAQPQMLKGVDVASMPKLPAPAPATDQVSLEKAKKQNDKNIDVQNEALAQMKVQAEAAARNTAIYSQLEKKLATADPREFGPSSSSYKTIQNLRTYLSGIPPDGLVNQAEVDKYLTQLGVGGSKQLLGADQQLRQQEMLTLLEHANPHLDQPLQTIKNLAAYGKAGNNYDLLAANTGIAAIRGGADPIAVPGAIESQSHRADYINGSLNTPQGAIDHLKQHPELAPQFKAKYGYLP